MIAENLRKLRLELPNGVTLVAVSKFHPEECLLEAYSAGQRLFGESRAAELEAKAAALPKDIQWHFIGHLQTNKVKKVVAVSSLIHSVDSDRLLRAIDTEAARTKRRIAVLIQLHVAQEETKFGFTPEEAITYITPQLVSSLTNTDIVGVMGMASNVDDEKHIRQDFRKIYSTFKQLESTVFKDNPEFKVVSMGMSHDWPLAVAEGANMVRVGTSIFGEREY